MKKILIIQTASIGDVILVTPLLEKLHAFYPEARLDILIKRGNESLFEGHPFLHKVYIWDKKQRKYRNWYSILAQVQNEKYDLLVNVQRFFSMSLFAVFSKARQTVGFSKSPLSLFFTKRFPHHIGKRKGVFMHEVERNLSLIQYLTDSSSLSPRLYPTVAQYAKVSHLKTRQYICIAPASLWFTKQFPKEKWIEWVNRLDSDLYVYYLGGNADIALCNEIIEQTRVRNSLNLSGKLSLLESAALMRDAVMNFVNDSSPMHLASSVNAKTTAIFCSTVPEFGFGPLSDESIIVQINENLKCRPCGLHGYKQCPQKHFKCALSIRTDEIAVV